MNISHLRILSLLLLSATCFFSCGQSSSEPAAGPSGEKEEKVDYFHNPQSFRNYNSTYYEELGMECPEGDPQLFIKGPVGYEYATVQNDGWALFEDDIVVTNMGGGQLEISNVTTTCKCVTVQYERKPLSHGEELAIHFQLDKRGRSPRESVYQIILYSNDVIGAHVVKLKINLVE